MMVFCNYMYVTVVENILGLDFIKRDVYPAILFSLSNAVHFYLSLLNFFHKLKNNLWPLYIESVLEYTLDGTVYDIKDSLHDLGELLTNWEGSKEPDTDYIEVTVVVLGKRKRFVLNNSFNFKTVAFNDVIYAYLECDLPSGEFSEKYDVTEAVKELINVPLEKIRFSFVEKNADILTEEFSSIYLVIDSFLYDEEIKIKVK